MTKGARPPSPLTPEEIARCLIPWGAAGSQDPATLIAQAEQAFSALHAALIVFLGAQGFNSLWARAMHLARRELQAQDLLATPAPSPSADRWVEATSQAEATKRYAVLIVQFTSFIALLYSFVGKEMGLRLIRPVLPVSPAPDNDMPPEDARP